MVTTSVGHEVLTPRSDYLGRISLQVDCMYKNLMLKIKLEIKPRVSDIFYTPYNVKST